MEMGRYLLRRVLLAVPTMLGVSLVVFLTIKLIPGDPTAALLGPRATPEARAAISDRYGLDQPLPVQYVKWLGQAVQGNLGDSIVQSRPVSEMIGPALDNTITLTLFAASVTVLGGALLGMVMAFGRSRASRSLASGVSLVAASTPQYSLGLILIVVFALNLDWLPAGGLHSPTEPSTLSSTFRHLILPGLTAAAIPTGIVARMFASALREEGAQPYVESDRARGLPERRVRLHILHGSLASLLTISGLQIGYLLGGVVFVEVVFSWPGVGQLIYQSIAGSDYAVIQAGVLLAALGFVVLNVLVDVARAALDPRVRRSGIAA
jgi:peptide/nickel transport system permease protein